MRAALAAMVVAPLTLLVVTALMVKAISHVLQRIGFLGE